MLFRKSLVWMTMSVVSCGAFYPHFPAQAALPDERQTALMAGDMHLTPKPLAFRYREMFMAANVVGYNYIGGMMLPLTFTASLTGSYAQVFAEDGRAEGWVETPDNAFAIDMAKRSVTVGGEERVLPQGVVSLVGNEMYVDASYLATILPVGYQINYETNIVELQPQKDLRVFQRMDFMSRYFEAIRKQAGLPYRPWTLEEAIAASSPQNPKISQPSLTPALRDSGVLDQQAGTANNGAPTPLIAPQAESIADAVPDAEKGVMQEGGPVPQDSGAPYEWSDSTPIAPANQAENNSETAINITGQNVVLNTQNIAPLQAVANPVLDENRLLILQPELSRIKGDYIEVYQHESGYYLPLGYLMDMLELGIGVNPATLEAEGFFITEDNTFYLNGTTNEAVIRGEKRSFPAGLVVANPFEVYVDARLLSELLPIDFMLNMSDLVLSILPREKLPLQANIERDQKWSRVAMWKQYMNNPNKNLPVVKTPYKPVTVPSIDVQTNSFYTSRTGDLRNSSSVLATGDIGYLDTETFAVVTNNQDETAATLRFQAGRSDRDGELLGPLNATEAYVGDVQSYPMPLVANSELGRGVKISNRNLLRPDQFDSTDFYGDAQPGWEVELYQNNVLIDFTVVGDDGRYSFTNVPVNYGDNTFRIVQYGPQGQKQEEVREFNIDDQMPAVGKLQYSLSANQFRQGLINIDNDANTSVNASGDAVIGMAEYGVNEKLSIGGGLAHVPVEDVRGNVGQYNFATANLRTSLFGARTNFNSAYDLDNGGWATGVTALSRYGMTTLRGEQQFYNDFDSAERLRSFLRPLTAEEILAGFTDNNIESRMRTRTDLGASRPFSLPLLGNFTGSGNFLLETFEAGERDLSLSGRVSKNVYGSNLSSTLRYRSLDRGYLPGDDYLDGSISVRHNFDNDLLLRTAMRYQIVPDLELAAMSLSLQKQWTEDFNTRFEYLESFGENSGRRVAGILNWDMGSFYLSPRLEVDEDMEYLVGLGLQFSLGVDGRTNGWYMTSDRIANSGAISARAFLDENADGVMNEGEKPLEGVGFNRGATKTNADGLVYIPRTAAFQNTRLSIDKGTVSGMGATPKEAAYAVVTRPGITTEIDYPVVPTLEIEGNAYLEQAQGDRIEYPNLLLELVNADGEVVREVRTEFDGYYYMADVYPGKYTLRVAEKERQDKALAANDYPIDTTAMRDEGQFEGFVSGYDFVLRRAETAVAANEAIPAEEAEQAVVLTDAPQVPAEELPAQAPVEEVEVAQPVLGTSPGVSVTAPVGAVATTMPEPLIPEEPSQPAEEAIQTPAMPPAATEPVVAEVAPPEPAVTFVEPRKPAQKSENVFIQAGMYCDYANAQRQVDTLTVAGFNAALKGRDYQGRACYLVHVGPAQDLASAEGIARRLQDMGMEKPIIVEENTQVYE